MARSLFDAFNLLYKGELCEQLHEWLEDGLTYEAMADRVAEDHGLRPSPSTLQRYVSGDCR